MQKDFWRESTIAVMGAGSFGTPLADLAAMNCREVRLWVRDVVVARSINSTRENSKYSETLKLSANIKAYSELERIISKDDLQRPKILFWALPSHACRAIAKEIAPVLTGDEIVIHVTKGIEAETSKRVSQILLEELPIRRIGVVSGPNLSSEISRGEPAGAVVASNFKEVREAAVALLSSHRFVMTESDDLIGVEWAGVFKNVLAIAAGALEALGQGYNMRALLITLGLDEMRRLGQAVGAKPETFLTLAGVGDLLATCSSNQSRNYRVGLGLGNGKKVSEIVEEIGSTAEGILTAQTLAETAERRGLSMPLTQLIYQFTQGQVNSKDFVRLMIETAARQ